MRILFLDGLRGVAILLVVLYHTFAWWPDRVPYGSQFAYFPPFQFGYLGVMLFFMISGFVILMSLDKTHSFTQFLYKRWLRLFPGMLIATILIYFTAQFLPERPWGIPIPVFTIPGLFFLDPTWVKVTTGMDLYPLEGSFWSLFVEWKFYLLFGFFYFTIGRINAVLMITGFFLISIIADISHNTELVLLSQLLSFNSFGWFASGALTYLYFVDKEKKYLIATLIMVSLQLFVYTTNSVHFIAMLTIVALFLIPVCFKKTRFLLENRFLQFVGFVSYPLYLIHENALIALIVKMHARAPYVPSLLLPIVPIIALSGIAYAIVQFVEPFVRQKIDSGLKKVYTYIH